MIEKLKEKAPKAQALVADIAQVTSEQKYDYIFVSSGSISLFTDIEVCQAVL